MVHPGELLATMVNDKLNLIMLDVRSEADYNLFHIRGARSVQSDQLNQIIPELLGEPASNTVIMLMSNDEAAAAEAWKYLTAESVMNVYILEGGINRWIQTFAVEEKEIQPTPTPSGNDRLGYTFPAALGARYDASFPNAEEFKLEYTPKIKMQLKRSPSGGGCG
jgi:rhodanese-related sulfurtransferase